MQHFESNAQQLTYKTFVHPEKRVDTDKQTENESENDRLLIITRTKLM